jgi:hypothetical protein
MRFFHSQKNFTQYKPQSTAWQKFFGKKKCATNDIFKKNKELKNPYIKEPKNYKKIKKILLALILMAALLFWAVLILYLPYFQIQNIYFKGNKIINTEDLNNFVNETDVIKGDFLNQKNFFLLNIKKLSSLITDNFKLQNTNIKKIFPDTIEIEIIEKGVSVIFDDNSGGLFLLDEDGKILKKIKSAQTNIIEENASSTLFSGFTINDYNSAKKEYGDYPIIKNSTTQNQQEKNIHIKKTLISAINEWANFSASQGGIGEAAYFEIDDTGVNVKIHTKNAWYIMASALRNIETQFMNFKKVLNTNKPVEYIDVRIEERVFWK